MNSLREKEFPDIRSLEPGRSVAQEAVGFEALRRVRMSRIERRYIGREMTGKITGNQLVGKPGSNSDGIFVRAAGASGTLTTLIQGNTITGWGNAGIHLQNNDGGATMNASIFGNSVTAPGAAFPFSPIFVDNGATAGDTSIMNLVLGGTSAAQKNTFSGTGSVAGISLSNFNAATTFNLSRNGSAGGTAAAIVIDDNNPLNPSNINTSGGGGTFNLVNTLPPTPP